MESGGRVSRIHCSFAKMCQSEQPFGQGRGPVLHLAREATFWVNHSNLQSPDAVTVFRSWDSQSPESHLSSTFEGITQQGPIDSRTTVTVLCRRAEIFHSLVGNSKFSHSASFSHTKRLVCHSLLKAFLACSNLLPTRYQQKWNTVLSLSKNNHSRSLCTRNSTGTLAVQDRKPSSIFGNKHTWGLSHEW